MIRIVCSLCGEPFGDDEVPEEFCDDCKNLKASLAKFGKVKVLMELGLIKPDVSSDEGTSKGKL